MQKFPRTRIKTVAQVPRADWSFSKHPLSSQHKQATRGCSLAVCAGPHRLNTYKIAGLSEYLQEYVKNVRFAPPAARSGVASATCVPPSEESLTLGPRVAHISAPQDSTLLETVAQELQLEQACVKPKAMELSNSFVCTRSFHCVTCVLSFWCLATQWFVHELIAFGAVHWCPVPPKRHSTAAQDGDGQVWKRDAALERFGRQAGLLSCWCAQATLVACTWPKHHCYMHLAKALVTYTWLKHPCYMHLAAQRALCSLCVCRCLYRSGIGCNVAPDLPCSVCLCTCPLLFCAVYAACQCSATKSLRRCACQSARLHPSPCPSQALSCSLHNRLEGVVLVPSQPLTGIICNTFQSPDCSSPAQCLYNCGKSVLTCNYAINYNEASLQHLMQMHSCL